MPYNTVRAYIDSNFLGDYIDAKTNPDKKHHVQRVKNRLSNCEIVIPQIVVGEMISVIIKNKSGDIRKLQDDFKEIASAITFFINPNECMFPIKLETIEHFLYIHCKCNVDATDAFILAYAVSDPDSEYFITTDTKLLHNSAITNYLNTLHNQGKRNNNLSITADP